MKGAARRRKGGAAPRRRSSTSSSSTVPPAQDTAVHFPDSCYRRDGKLKQRYPTEAAARAHIRFMVAKGIWRQGQKRPYPCDAGIHGWHVGGNRGGRRTRGRRRGGRR